MAFKRVALITGASKGIGRSIANYLAQKEFIVFGTSRKPDAFERPKSWSLVQLDVCSEESVQCCVKDILEKEGRLDILINNAGYGLNGALEDATLEQAKAQFETNYFGPVRMIKVVLPIMRAQLGGNIINISSGMASTRLPFMGHYTAAKCALEGFSEVLRREVKPFGIHVSVVEPGFIKTKIAETIDAGKDIIKEYEPWRTRWLNAFLENVLNGSDADVVADCVFRILSNKRPRFFYVVGQQVTLGIWIHNRLPESLYDWIIRKSFGVTDKSDNKKSHIKFARKI